MSYGVRTSGRRLRSRAFGEGHDAQSIRRSRARSRADRRSRPAPPSGSGRQHPPRALHTRAAEAAAHRAAGAAVDPRAASGLRRDRAGDRACSPTGSSRRGHDVTLLAAPGSRSCAHVVPSSTQTHADEIGDALIDVRPCRRALGDRSTPARGTRRAVRRRPRPLAASRRVALADRIDVPVLHTLHGPFDDDDRARSTADTPRRSGCRRSAGPSSTRRRPGCAASASIPNPIDLDALAARAAQGRLPAVDRAHDPRARARTARSRWRARPGCRWSSPVRSSPDRRRSSTQRDRAAHRRRPRPLRGRGRRRSASASCSRTRAALLMPIRWPEPFGMVMIEAMACGTPVIAFPEGSAPEVVVDGRVRVPRRRRGRDGGRGRSRSTSSTRRAAAPRSPSASTSTSSPAPTRRAYRQVIAGASTRPRPVVPAHDGGGRCPIRQSACSTAARSWSPIATATSTPDARLPPHGFFCEDTRFVSRWRLSVQGAADRHPSDTRLDYFVAQFFLVSPSPGFHAAPRSAIVRQRLIGDIWLEDVVVVNHRDEHVAVARRRSTSRPTSPTSSRSRTTTSASDRSSPQRRDRELVLRYRNGDFLRETHDHGQRAGGRSTDDGLRLNLRLAPREERRVSFAITPARRRSTSAGTPRGRRSGSFEECAATPRRARRLDGRRSAARDRRATPLRHAYDRSLVDLAALRFHPHIGTQDVSLPAAGLPWFMTLFGRDSLITSYQALPYRPELAATTLRTLAARQGTACDDFRDAGARQDPARDPLRRADGASASGRTRRTTAPPTRPRCSCRCSTSTSAGPATPTLVRALEPSAARGARVDRPLRRPRRRRLRRVRRRATRRPGWSTSAGRTRWNSILFADGRSRAGPIAICEIQGYVYDAKRRGARLAREVWDDPALADRLEAEADALRPRFQRGLLDPRAAACFALALDGDKRQVDSLSSNIGHLLWSGIVDDERAEAVAGI